MNKHSILFKISIFFLVAFVMMTILFDVMYNYEFTSAKEKLRSHYHHVAMSIMRWKFADGTKEQLLKDLAEQNIEIIDDKEFYKSLLKEKRVDRVQCARGHFDLYEKDNYRYIISPKNTGSLLLRDNKTEFIDIYYVWILYGLFVLVLFALYISIAVSIYPLKNLQLKIKRFGEGEMNIDFTSKKKDEIADVSNEFDLTVKKIQNMVNARAIFLRNITHELKTPITKGKLSLEFIENSKTKEILNNVFTRLDLLICEFLRIENVTSCNCSINKKEYHIADIIDNAVDLLFLEKNSIKHNVKSEKFFVDFDLMSIVFKNLIDNGLKYSYDANVSIYIEGQQLYFCSNGEKMSHDLEYYIQPFTKHNMSMSSDSFGLGLYIVNYIIEKHGFSFSYKYEKGKNIFILSFFND